MFPYAAITCHNTISWGDTGVSSEQQPRRSSLELNQSQVPFHAVELEDWMALRSCLDCTMQCARIKSSYIYTHKSEDVNLCIMCSQGPYINFY